MTKSLNELRGEQDWVREKLFDLYSTRYKSILDTSKEIGISYSSLRSFMLGKRLSDINILKVKAKIEEWTKEKL